MSKLCPNCKYQNEDSASFCLNCGAKIDGGQQTAATANQSQKQAVDPNDPYRYYPGYTLVDFLEYIFYLLQYCDECIDCNSFSNSEAGLWYRHNKDKPGLFPCDDKEFPLYRELFEEETDTMPGEELSEAPASTFSAPGGSAEGEDDASLSTMDLLYS